MRTFTSQTTISSITRITGYVGNLSQSTTITGVSCYLRPLSEVESATNGFQYGWAYNAIFETDVDIREQDKVTIGGVVYLVKGVARHNRGIMTGYIRALIVKPEL